MAKKNSAIAKFFNRTGNFFLRIWRETFPGSKAWKGAAIAVTIVSICLFIVNSWYIFASAGWQVFLISLAAFVLAWLILGAGLYLAYRLVRQIPSAFVWTFLASVFLLSFVFLPVSKWMFFIPLLILIFAALIGAGLNVLFKKGWSRLLLLQKVVLITGFTLGCIGIIFMTAFLLVPGFENRFEGASWISSEPAADLLVLGNPGEKGEYEVAQYVYSSEGELHRKEFQNPDWFSVSVDGSEFVSGWSWLREWYWGFDRNDLPVNGRVYSPVGEGPFPLVLIVHGNHSMTDYSDGGYEYLGSILASRGFLVVSVDENFLNGSTFANLYGYDDLKDENDARAWLMLEHLVQWDKWNQDPQHQFYGRVDMENIALIGHSRGGEAVYLAAGFNRLERYPDDAKVKLDYHFNIKTIIGIAPVDGQYEPAGIEMPLSDINYLVFQGSHDMDLSTFMGMEPYERLEFNSGEQFVKAAVFIEKANHGQFNSSWGAFDMPLPTGWLYNTAQLIPQDQQQQIAALFINAFLESTLHDRSEYLQIFKNYRSAGNWLPDVRFIQRYDQNGTVVLCNFEEDIDVLTTSFQNGTIRSQRFDFWKEDVIPARKGHRDSRAVFLSWDRISDQSFPVYSISLNHPPMDLSAESSLAFSIADRRDLDEIQSASDKLDETITFSIEVKDIMGEIARVALPDDQIVPVCIESSIYKLEFFQKFAYCEPILQDFFIEMDQFLRDNPKLNLSSINRIQLIFDQTEQGEIIVDNLRFLL